MKLILKIWRQKNSSEKGKIVSYDIENISPDMSFLEMMDVLNEQLTEKPELVNDDPLGAAWFFKMKLTDPSEIDGLMDEDAYKELIG